nr:type II toxin-antitoxin system YoeB family toxin [Sphingomonas sp. Leaf4]
MLADAVQGDGQTQAAGGGNLSGWWSRRISHEYRVAGSGDAQVVEVAQCQYHYQILSNHLLE